MSNYEILLIVNPKADVQVAKTVAEKAFGAKQIKKAEKYNRTELAYPINGVNKAIYFLIEVNTTPEKLTEFVRLSNIEKNIWRHMIINLESERTNAKLSKKEIAFQAKMKKIREEKQKRRESMPSEKSDNGGSPRESRSWSKEEKGKTKDE